MRARMLLGGAVFALALVSCARASTPSCHDDAGKCSPEPSRALAETPHKGLGFVRSPGGTLEVAPDQVARVLALAPAPGLRVVDVRERAELDDELGHIAGVEWVPLGELPEASEGWDPAAPVVLVCRSGRRSARGAEQLEALGFRNVASMTGGMLRWNALRLPTGHSLVSLSANAAPVSPLPPATDAAPVPLDPAHVRWVRTAALLATGSESCVDGREPHAVIGTPGGDAGELLLALAAAEQVSGQQFAEREVSALLDAWMDAFGRLYLHSDVHALEALRRALIRDPRFASSLPIANAAAMEDMVRHPPRALEPALIEHLVEPENVGCGHLRSMLLAPDSYQVRRELVVAVLRDIFERLWRAPDGIDWVVLSGEHHERAVVVVRLDGEIRPYTKVPAIAPSSELGQAFVAHPQVTAYLREQNAHLLFEQLPTLRRRVTVEQLSAAIRVLAERQLDATLSRLAAGLPRYEVRFHGRLPGQVSVAPAADGR